MQKMEAEEEVTKMPDSEQNEPNIPSTLEVQPGSSSNPDISEQNTGVAQNVVVAESGKSQDVPVENPLPVDITEKVDVAKNTDLFRAIFLSSSESESEEEELQEKEDQSVVLKANILTDQLVPKIKTKKDGILSNVDFTQFTAKVQQNENIAVEETELKEDKNKELEATTTINTSAAAGQSILLYGPKIPEKIISAKAVPTLHVEENIGQWVEKNCNQEVKLHKHKKKKKKEKHEHKKKHKHKREKKRK